MAALWARCEKCRNSGKFTMKRARAVLYWAGLPIGGKCKYLLAPETCLLHRDPCFCKRTWYVSTIMTKGP